MWIFVPLSMKKSLLALKKAYVMIWCLLFTFWCMLRVYFNAWMKSPERSLQFNAYLTKHWGSGLQKILNVPLTFKGAPISKTPTLFVGNHMSYLDIILFYTLRNATFVAKREVSKWPVFGVAAASVGTVFVDRDSVASRAATSEAMRVAIKERNQSVVIFPEGTSSLYGKTWRRGALRMAQDADLWVQPFTIYYNPARPAAYIDDDHLVTHLWHWVINIPITAQIYFFEPRKITDCEKQSAEIQTLVQSKWQQMHEEATGVHQVSGS